MKWYEMVEPISGEDSTPVFNILSEEEIVESTYGTYVCLMYISRLGKLPTREQIIEEWVILHWANEITGEES